MTEIELDNIERYCNGEVTYCASEGLELKHAIEEGFFTSAEFRRKHLVRDCVSDETLDKVTQYINDCLRQILNDCGMPRVKLREPFFCGWNLVFDEILTDEEMEFQ